MTIKLPPLPAKHNRYMHSEVQTYATAAVEADRAPAFAASSVAVGSGVWTTPPVRAVAVEGTVIRNMEKMLGVSG